MNEGSAHGERIVADVEAHLDRVPGATRLERRADGLWMVAPTLDVLTMAETMNRLEARLSAMTGVALDNGETGIIYHYCLGCLAINIKTETHNRVIRSITPITRAADWSEREIYDLFGVHFTDHPNLARLIRPPSLPAGFFRDSGGAASRD
jgi:hypothetical protein